MGDKVEARPTIAELSQRASDELASARLYGGFMRIHQLLERTA